MNGSTKLLENEIKDYIFLIFIWDCSNFQPSLDRHSPCAHFWHNYLFGEILLTMETLLVHFRLDHFDMCFDTVSNSLYIYRERGANFFEYVYT